MNFYWSHPIALQKLSNERCYKFSWILTLTEVISIIRNLRFFARLKKCRPLNQGTLNSANVAEPKRHIKNYSRRQTTDRQMKLRSNTHGCELIMYSCIVYSITLVLCRQPIESVHEIIWWTRDMSWDKAVDEGKRTRKLYHNIKYKNRSINIEIIVLNYSYPLRRPRI